MRASDVFVKALEAEGVKYVFGVPGEETLDLLDSLRNSSITFIPTRHEQAAGFMAATVGRLTGKAGVCLSTLGPGATNFLTSTAYAQLGAMPAIFITGQKPITKSKQGAFQVIHATRMFNPVTKLTKRVLSPDSVPVIVREAFRISEEERPGAVHIELAEDIAALETDAELLPISEVRRPVAERRAIEKAILMIQEAKRPLILVGAGANRKRTARTLTAFIEKTGIPFFNTQMGKGVVDEHHSQYIGTAALSANDYLHCAVDKADLIINVGHDVVEKPPFLKRKGGAKVIHINFFGAQVDAIYSPELEVVGDIANALWQLKEAIVPQPHWNFDEFFTVRDFIRARFEMDEGVTSMPMTPQRIVKEVGEAMSEKGIIALDNGMYKIWFARHHRASRPNELLLDNALATMGAGIPSALAAKLIEPESDVVAVVGDGGLLMSVAELETAKRMGVSLPIVVLNDNAYGMIRWKQEASGMTDFGLSFSNPNFKTLAEAFGAKGRRVERAGELTMHIKEAVKEGGLHLIEVPIDYSPNLKVLTEELKNKTCPI